MDEKPDYFAGIADDIATNHTKPSLNSEETIWVTPSWRVTSPTRGPPLPCKQALRTEIS